MEFFSRFSSFLRGAAGAGLRKDAVEPTPDQAEAQERRHTIDSAIGHLMA
jgi:hypothetical protein